MDNLSISLNSEHRKWLKDFSNPLSKNDHPTDRALMGMVDHNERGYINLERCLVKHCKEC